MLSLKKTRKKKKPEIDRPCSGELNVYFRNCYLPPGISNVAYNCYASSLLQCLCNHPTFLEIFSSSNSSIKENLLLSELCYNYIATACAFPSRFPCIVWDTYVHARFAGRNHTVYVQLRAFVDKYLSPQRGCDNKQCTVSPISFLTAMKGVLYFMHT